MSRNSKNATRMAQAKAISKLHQSGGKGPAKTTPKHGKRWTYRSNSEIQKRIVEQQKAANAGQMTVRGKIAKTSGAAILAQAGAASADED